MALTFALVEATPNRLRYSVTASAGGGTTANLSTIGSATPDVLTDAPQGPIKKLAKAVADGFAAFAAGAQTQAKARALWLSDWSGADPAPGEAAGQISAVTTAICRITPRTTAVEWSVDADVSGGNPIITVGVSTLTGNGVAYLDIMVPEALGG